MPTTNQTRITEIEKQLADLREQYQAAKAEREATTGAAQKIKELKEKLQTLEHEATLAEREADYDRVAKLRYNDIPQAQKELVSLEASETKSDTDVVTPEDIATIVAKWTGIPATKLIQTEAEKLTHLEDHLTERVVGQDHAVSVVSRAIRRSKAGLQDADRPLASFLFLGPTGVGKTELAKSLAQFLFDDEKAMIRIDMSEYMDRHNVAKLIGSPPGYIGHEEGGQLTEAVRRKPYSVILFDEVEKAHPDVFNVLLQMLDDGRLTDSKGRTVSFTNTIIIMTSNIGSEKIISSLSSIGSTSSSSNNKSAQEVKNNLHQKLMHELQTFFRPEFLNRLDDVIIFDPISPEALTHIVDIQLSRLSEKLLKEKNITLTVSNDAKKLLADTGYDPLFGARPLKRTIQNLVLDELAMQLLEGKIGEGDSVMIQSAEGNISMHTTTHTDK